MFRAFAIWTIEDSSGKAPRNYPTVQTLLDKIEGKNNFPDDGDPKNSENDGDNDDDDNDDDDDSSDDTPVPEMRLNLD